MSAYDPKRTSLAPFQYAGLGRYDAFSLSLGGGNETTQNRRQRRKNTTPQDVEAAQCAKDRATSQLFRFRSARANQCSHTRTERGAGATHSDLRSAEGHLKLARAIGARLSRHTGKRGEDL